MKTSTIDCNKPDQFMAYMSRRSLRAALSIAWMCAIVKGALGTCQLFWRANVGGYARLIILPTAVNFRLGSSDDGWGHPRGR